MEKKDKMTLMDGAEIETFPISPASCKNYEAASTFELDKTGSFFSLFGKKKSVRKDKEAKERELFLNNAYFLFANADRILADSRMFLSPICIQNGLAYTGTSSFKKPTLGIYIEWWKSCEASAVIDGKGRMELVYHLAGSPLSGCNKCGLVDKDGKTRIMQLPNFKGLWTTFAAINTRYAEQKETCAAFTLQEVITMLRAKDEDTALREATLNCMLLRTKMESLQAQLQQAREQISSMDKELIMCKIELKLDTVLPFYKEYLQWAANTRKDLNAIHNKLIELRRQFKMNQIAQTEYQQEVKALERRKEDLEAESRDYGCDFLSNNFSEHAITIKHLESFFNNHKELLIL